MFQNKLFLLNSFFRHVVTLNLGSLQVLLNALSIASLKTTKEKWVKLEKM